MESSRVVHCIDILAAFPDNMLANNAGLGILALLPSVMIVFALIQKKRSRNFLKLKREATMTKPIIGSAYDPQNRPRLDDDAQRVQRALVPGFDTEPGIEFPRITPDGVVFTVSAMIGVVLFLIWIWSMIG
jgi:hypothetical protein